MWSLEAAVLSNEVNGSSAADAKALTEKPLSRPGSVTAAGKLLLKNFRLFIMSVYQDVGSAQMKFGEVGEEQEQLFQ
jgi:hypothetical protein